MNLNLQTNHTKLLKQKFVKMQFKISQMSQSSEENDEK